MATLPEGVTIRDGAEFADHDALTRDILAIDEICYGELAPDDTGTVDYWAEIDRYSYYRVACRGGRVIGYVSIHPFSEMGAAAILAGEVRDGYMLPLIDRGGVEPVVLYVCSIAVLPEFRGTGVAGELLESCVRGILASGREVTAAYATMWGGERFWSRYEPREVARDPLGHPVVRLHALAAMGR